MKRSASKPASRPNTKQSQLIALLRSRKGATMARMTTLTGWQPHTVRSVLSAALRKRLGLNVRQAIEAGGIRVYRIVAAEAPAA